MNDSVLAEKMQRQKSITTLDIVINAALFQASWFTAVLVGGYWALLPVCAMLLHFVLIMHTSSMLTLGFLAILGILMDSLYLALDVYQFADDAALPILNLPVWLACLWLGFCLSLPVSLAWLVRKAYLFVLACAVLGPISYLAGRHWQVVDFADSEIILLVLEWSIFAIVAAACLQPRLSDASAAAPEAKPLRR